MPKKVKEYSAIEVRRITQPGMHSVGAPAGLLLKVSKTGARSWILRARVAGKRRHIGLGGYPDVTLADARTRARSYKSEIDAGRDPIAERQAARDEIKAEAARRLIFADAARQCHEGKEPEFRNAKHGRDWINSIDRYANPIIGDRPVADIGLTDVLAVLQPIWREKTETATRVRQRLESVLTWATVTGYRDGPNPARWQGNLSEALPAPKKITKVKHHRALDWREIPEFMAALRNREGMAAQALAFLILTAARSGEVRGARWDEIDRQARTWTVPAERMKGGKTHVVHLSDDALAILDNVPEFQDNPLVFPAPRGKAMSDATMAAVLKRMGIDATVHGFRSAFKDWARNCTSFVDEVSELALAHVNSDATHAAYARDGLLAKRAQMLGQWAQFCRGD